MADRKAKLQKTEGLKTAVNVVLAVFIRFLQHAYKHTHSPDVSNKRKHLKFYKKVNHFAVIIFVLAAPLEKP